MRDALAGLRRALDAYRADPVNADDQASSWQALDDLLYACDAALAARSEPHGVDHHTDGTHGCDPGAWMECRRCNPLAARSEPGVTEERLARALIAWNPWFGAEDKAAYESAAALLRHLRETS
jgi:hypothetical protein